MRTGNRPLFWLATTIVLVLTTEFAPSSAVGAPSPSRSAAADSAAAGSTAGQATAAHATATRSTTADSTLPESRAAALSGKPVEIPALRTETEQVFANPSGTFTLDESTLPVRVRRGTGWVPVDTTLRQRPDGTVAPVAAAVDLVLSGAASSTASTPLVRALKDGKSFGLGWPGALPKPVLDGSTATYAEVLPGVDLVVTVSVLGYSEVLKVKTPEAARQPALQTIRLTTAASDLTVKVDGAGNTTAVDPAGQPVFQAGTPLLWDSAGEAVAAQDRLTGPATGAHHQTMATTAEAGAIVLHAGLDAAGLTFPVYVDPNVNYAGSKLAWTSVWKAHPNSEYYNSSDIARVGHENETGMTNRSFFRMNTAPVKGTHIIKATFRTYLSYSFSCDARPVELWRIPPFSSTTNWTNQADRLVLLDTVSVAKGYNSSCNPGGVDFNATAGVVTAAAANANDLSLGLYASSETDTKGWKKFRNNPTLEIEYNTVPAVPTAMSTDPGLPCLTGAGRPAVGTTTPTVRAQITDADGAKGQTVAARFEWNVAGGAEIGETLTTAVTSGTVQSVTIPAGAFTTGGTYSWRVRGEDGTDAGPWSAPCELTIDTVPPGSAPRVASTVYPETPAGAEPVYRGGIGVPGSFTFTSGTGDTDITGFVYGLNAFPPTTSIGAAGAPATATVTVTPTTDLLNTLYVRSKDSAGNLGPIYSYQFYVRPATFPAGS